MGADILWHNSQSNETQIWFMDERGDGIKHRATVVDENGYNIFLGPPWRIVGVSPGEIVWHNSQSNETQIWFMEGNQIKGRATVVDENVPPHPRQGILIGPPWSIVGVSTFSMQPAGSRHPGHPKPDNPELGDPTGSGNPKPTAPADPPPDD